MQLCFEIHSFKKGKGCDSQLNEGLKRKKGFAAIFEEAPLVIASAEAWKCGSLYRDIPGQNHLHYELVKFCLTRVGTRFWLAVKVP